ncbi:MAG TPA: GNAT family N-acetyltransferase [Spirochaetaceae bacterium]|nr:GNAT family N-acetyltransferase [Spirochaetaceae bacterium]
MMRLAKKSDIDDLHRLLADMNAIHAELRPDIFKIGGIKYTKEEIGKKIAECTEPIFVYEEEGAVLGYAFCMIQEVKETNLLLAQKYVYIDDLCVDGRFRSKSIGSRLYEYVREYAKSIGANRVRLIVWEGNDKAVRFYLRQGMKPLITVMDEAL